MPIIVNGHEFSDAEIAAVLPEFQDSDNPQRQATTSLIIRRVLLDEARSLGLYADDEQSLLDLLLEQEVAYPQASAEECQRYYQNHPDKFRVGDLVEASHILFQVTDKVDLPALRAHANVILQQVLAQPERFAELAQANSNCPSAQVGGNLGQLSRGDCVPEFDRAIFNAEAHSTIAQLVESRFGLHIIQLGRKQAGTLLPLAQVQSQIANALEQASYNRALQQYLKLALGRAQISGIELDVADSPLLQ